MPITDRRVYYSCVRFAVRRVYVGLPAHWSCFPD